MKRRSEFDFSVLFFSSLHSSATSSLFLSFRHSLFLDLFSSPQVRKTRNAVSARPVPLSRGAARDERGAEWRLSGVGASRLKAALLLIGSSKSFFAALFSRQRGIAPPRLHDCPTVPGPSTPQAPPRWSPCDPCERAISCEGSQGAVRDAKKGRAAPGGAPSFFFLRARCSKSKTSKSVLPLSLQAQEKPHQPTNHAGHHLYRR